MIQERPLWCPYRETCQFLRRAEDSFCLGRLPTPSMHGEIANTHRLCIHDSFGEQTVNVELYVGDLVWLDWLFDLVKHDDDIEEADANREPGGET